MRSRAFIFFVFTARSLCVCFPPSSVWYKGNSLSDGEDEVGEDIPFDNPNEVGSDDDTSSEANGRPYK